MSLQAVLLKKWKKGEDGYLHLLEARELGEFKVLFPYFKKRGSRNGFPIAIDLKCGKVKECVVKTFYFWIYSHSYLLNWETLN